MVIVVVAETVGSVPVQVVDDVLGPIVRTKPTGRRVRSGGTCTAHPPSGARSRAFRRSTPDRPRATRLLRRTAPPEQAIDYGAAWKLRVAVSSKLWLGVAR